VNSTLQALASVELYYLYLKTNPSKKTVTGVTSALLDDLKSLKEPRSPNGIRAKLLSVPTVEKNFIDGMEQNDSSEFLFFLLDWVEQEVNPINELIENLAKKEEPIIRETNTAVFTKSGRATTCIRKRSPLKPTSDIFQQPLVKPTEYGYSICKDIPMNELKHLSNVDFARERKLPTLFQPNPFSGILKSSLNCTTYHQCDSYSNFFHLSVPVGRDLDSCFREFTKREKVEFKCETCEAENGKEPVGIRIIHAECPYVYKQLSIAHPPKILCVHFQRLVQGRSGLRKVDSFVEYKTRFDIAPYCSASLSGDKVKPLYYNLCAIIVHLGGPGGGHYITYQRQKKRDAWVYSSDTAWKVVSTQEALSNEAFMLFYSIE
jgi:ubiquitin C-terminal hydrolase